MRVRLFFSAHFPVRILVPLALQIHCYVQRARPKNQLVPEVSQSQTGLLPQVHPRCIRRFRFQDLQLGFQIFAARMQCRFHPSVFRHLLRFPRRYCPVDIQGPRWPLPISQTQNKCAHPFRICHHRRINQRELLRELWVL